MPAFCGNHTALAMRGGLQSFSRRGRRSYRNACLFVGAPPSGRWVVVCGLHRREGAAPTGKYLPFVGAIPPSQCSVVCKAFRDEGVAPSGMLAFLWEPRPRGDGLWSVGSIAARALLLQGNACLLWEPYRLANARWFAKLLATRASLLVWIDLSIGVGCFTAISLFLLSSRSVTVDQGLRG